jgi:cytochrome d ubiquinol oxidase subunit I
MNTPTGFTFVGGRFTDIDPICGDAHASRTPRRFTHDAGRPYAAGDGCRGDPRVPAAPGRRTTAFNRKALTIGLLVGAPAAVLQPFSGDIAARFVARRQPVKLAAMEVLYETQAGAPITFGPGIEIPRALSLLAFHDPHAVVQGLDRVPRDEWPNVTLVHVSFDVMVALGMYLALVGLWAGWLALRKRDVAAHRPFLRAVAIATPCGFIAVEAGWMVTELGRQPWVIYGVLKTADAVTPMPGLIVPFTTITLVYCALAVIVTRLLYRHIVQ